ncbi:MAG TPA: bifunctional [glutamate--ammonia ligase]-adenylyl-L-tyrosine phosphorylase/[glutamate--ammonia-ligase] adenylyltransferase [Verrucomicrobiae bacterium]|jgi:glutamate-ammonia-ligase adenylyltransferase|nr:bifunctional [glutamate--ammonia ligase]-adenylyl-L-tyrosine phosphorylase/[glutamate--ammonia-ligase] adenylyltransferase [Verrucomicrobiae bacterium]
MKNPAIAKAIRSAVDPERARHFFDLLSETDAGAALEKISPEQANLLAALFSGSQALGNSLAAHPAWLSHLEVEHLRFPRRGQGLRQEVHGWLAALLKNKDYGTALGHVREFKQREMLRIAARDLAHPGHVPEITREISDVADVCLEAVWQICRRQLAERFGEPWHQDAQGGWQRTEFCILGMGKLGGQELNYSSDVDVLFVYSEEGQVFKCGSAGVSPASARSQSRQDAAAPRSVMSNHQFFTRLAEAFIAEVSRPAPEGMLYRIDLRLRPEGDSGPLCRSLGSYENYYAQWGQTWERMMLIKARLVAGNRNLAGEFFETIQSFRYPRSIQETVLHEIGAMKDRIENEVVRAEELERNVKLGRGGIREVEFIAQSQQLLQAGRLPFLQGAQTLPALEKLAQYDLFPDAEARALRDAYCFLRDVEHRLQMEENLQTHTIPTDRAARERLAKLMQFKTVAAFETERRKHTDCVRAIFNRLFKTEKPAAPEDRLPREFSGAEAEWEKLLAEHSFREPEKMVPLLREFAEGPGYVHVSSRTVELARRLLPRLLAMCPRNRRTGILPVSKSNQKKNNGDRPNAVLTLSDPDRVVTRLDSFIAAYGARSTLFELWNSNPAIFDLVALLFDRSEFLAELAIRTPDMVDVLVTSGRLRRRKTSEEALRDLRHGLADADQKLWLRRYHQAELMRIGLRDILGLADPEQYLTELSALADACLQYAVESVMRRHKLKAPPFVIVGLGKLGGAEIDYGSDLDIIFVADAPAKNLPKLGRLALEVMDLISTRTELGLVFHMDARLRPDGEKGLLVNTLGANEEYYRERAQLWEIQTLTRARAVAGNFKLGARFQKMAACLADFSKRRGFSTRFGADWKNKIHEMRMRIEKERTPAGKDDLAIKTGRGGLVDAEFIAQALCLENGWHEANTLRALERGREAGVLPGAEKLIENYRQLRRVEGILRRWSYEGETVLPDDPEPYHRVSVRCGFATPEEFREALAVWRRVVREVYAAFFGTGRKKG